MKSREQEIEIAQLREKLAEAKGAMKQMMNERNEANEKLEKIRRETGIFANVAGPSPGMPRTIVVGFEKTTSTLTAMCIKLRASCAAMRQLLGGVGICGLALSHGWVCPSVAPIRAFLNEDSAGAKALETLEAAEEEFPCYKAIRRKGGYECRDCMVQKTCNAVCENRGEMNDGKEAQSSEQRA